VSEPTTQVVVLRAAAAALGAGVVLFAAVMVVIAGFQTFKRAAVLPLAVRFASSRLINVVSVLGVAVGVAALIIVISVMNGFIAESKRLIRGAQSDMSIIPLPVGNAQGGTRLPAPFDAYRKALAGTPHVAAIAPRFIWYGLMIPNQRLGFHDVSRRGSRMAVELRGIDPALERGVSDLSKWLGPILPDELIQAEERFVFRPVDDLENPLKRLEAPEGLPKDSAIPGVTLAVDLGLMKGQRVEIVTWRPQEPGAAQADVGSTPNMFLDVAGMFHTQRQEFDAKTVLVSISTLQKLLSQTGSDFTEIAVKLDDYRNAEEARHEISTRLLRAGLIRDPTREVRTWEDLNRTYIAAVDNERGLLAVILFFMVIVATFILFATLSMMVTEKTRDVGILSTLGASGAEILAVFVDVGVAMTVAGEALGLALGLLVTWNLNSIERFLDERFGLKLFNPEVYLLKSLPSVLDWNQVGVILALTVVAGVLFSVYPAIRAARLDPARALRYE